MHASSLSIPFQVTHGCLVASLHGVIDDSHLTSFQNRILQEVKTTLVNGVVLDMSQVRIIDDMTFERLSQVSDALEMLGYAVTYCGFQPPVVAALVHFEVDISRAQAFFNLECAIRYLNGESNEQISGLEKDENETEKGDEEVETSAESDKPDG